MTSKCRKNLQGLFLTDAGAGGQPGTGLCLGPVLASGSRSGSLGSEVSLLSGDTSPFTVTEGLGPWPGSSAHWTGGSEQVI